MESEYFLERSEKIVTWEVGGVKQSKKEGFDIGMKSEGDIQSTALRNIAAYHC